MTAIRHTVAARDLRGGDRIVGFTHDADVGITGIEVMESGGIMLSMVVIDHDGHEIAGRTVFIAIPTSNTASDVIYKEGPSSASPHSSESSSQNCAGATC